MTILTVTSDKEVWEAHAGKYNDEIKDMPFWNIFMSDLPNS